jgi:GTP-binding protein HflX
VPQIRVYNKIDKLDRQTRRANNHQGKGRAVWLSAVTGEGIPLLLRAVAERLEREKVRGIVHLHPNQGRQRALLFDMGAVSQEFATDDGGWTLELNMGERDLHRFVKRENLPPDFLERLVASPPPGAVTQR